eukprot:2136286-Prymnesium_polylepis.2
MAAGAFASVVVAWGWLLEPLILPWPAAPTPPLSESSQSCSCALETPHKTVRVGLAAASLTSAVAAPGETPFRRTSRTRSGAPARSATPSAAAPASPTPQPTSSNL